MMTWLQHGTVAPAASSCECACDGAGCVVMRVRCPLAWRLPFCTLFLSFSPCRTPLALHVVSSPLPLASSGLLLPAM
jgi:hypothetical protein